jgi:hypothetical protein
MAAREVGTLLADRGWIAIFGAGPVGLMGAFAESYARHGRELIGVVPNDLYIKEKGAHKVAMTIVTTPTIFERKRRMIEGTDLFIVLPGGIGTLDELFEILEMRFHSEIRSRIVLYAPDDFWDSVIQFIDRVIEAGYATDEHKALLERASSVQALATVLDGVEMEAGKAASKIS